METELLNLIQWQRDYINFISENYPQCHSEASEYADVRRQAEIDMAKDILRKYGYYVDNLWQTKDVMDGFECTDSNKAYSILSEVLSSEQTAVNIFEQIGLIVEAK
jgi:hypothetical protein